MLTILVIVSAISGLPTPHPTFFRGIGAVTPIRFNSQQQCTLLPLNSARRNLCMTSSNSDESLVPSFRNSIGEIYYLPKSDDQKSSFVAFRDIFRENDIVKQEEETGIRLSFKRFIVPIYTSIATIKTAVEDPSVEPDLLVSYIKRMVATYQSLDRLEEKLNERNEVSEAAIVAKIHADMTEAEITMFEWLIEHFKGAPSDEIMIFTARVDEIKLNRDKLLATYKRWRDLLPDAVDYLQ